jgi:2-methylcitrate dehydratase PrpD
MFTEKLTEFICKTTYEDLPPELVSAAKWAILDYVAVTMAGSQEPSGKIMSELVRESQSPPEATVIGGRYKASCSMAALTNGTSAHTQDYDDCLDFPNAGLAHPTAGTFSGLLAVGEKHHAAGKDMLTAYCLGIEAYGKIGLLLVSSGVGGHGWDWTGVLGVVGGTAALSKLLGLNEYQTMMALGTAATMSSGTMRNFGSMAGHIHGGDAARNAIEACTLAQKGYTATFPGIFEGPGGFYGGFSGNPGTVPESVQQERLNALGNPWNLLNPGLMFKYYPCAHIAHFGAYAGQQLKQKYSFDWRQISEIEFRQPTALARNSSPPPPRDGIQGRFNMGYVLCRALIHGEIDFGFFTDEAVKDPNTRELMSKLKWSVVQEEYYAGPFGYQEVVVKMKDGKTYSCKIDHPRGEPQNPQTPEELVAKFRKCALYARYPESAISRVKDMILDFENVKDVTELAALLGQ